MTEQLRLSLPEHYSLSPEFRLLASCSWIAPDAMVINQKENIISLCNDNTDWNEFIALVDHHKVPTLAYSQILRYAKSVVPEDIKHILKRKAHKVQMQSLAQVAELSRLMRLFNMYGIDVLPLKGVILSQYLFNDCGMRQSRDIDVLIKFEDIDRAVQLLDSEGYRCKLLNHNVTPKQMKHMRQTERHYVFYNNNSDICFELHWDCFLWQPLKVLDLWNCAVPKDWMGNKIYYLNDTAQILYLCDHGAMHKWFRLKWLSDIAMIYAKNGSLDWLALLKMSELFGTTRVIHQTALLLNWIYGIQLDNVFENLISKENKSVFLAKQAMNAIVDRSYSVERSLEGLKKTKYIVMLKPTVSYTEILRVSLASPGDFFQIRLKDNFFWLYVPLRPLLWLWRRFVKKSEV